MTTVPSRRGRKRKKRLLLILLLLLIAALLAVNIWALFFRQGTGILPPDYAPMEEDKNATDIQGDSSDKIDVSEGMNGVGLTYSNQVLIDLSEGQIALIFQNPGRSLNNMVLQIIVQDTLLAQSDLLIPGKQLNKMPLKNGLQSRLQPGVYTGKFVVSIYDPETGERAMVDAQAEIIITVTE